MYSATSEVAEVKELEQKSRATFRKQIGDTSNGGFTPQTRGCLRELVATLKGDDELISNQFGTLLQTIML